MVVPASTTACARGDRAAIWSSPTTTSAARRLGKPPLMHLAHYRAWLTRATKHHRRLMRCCRKARPIASLGVRLVACGYLFQPSGGSAPRGPVGLRIMAAVELLVEALGVECAGGVGNAGNERKRNKGGLDGLHGFLSLVQLKSRASGSRVVTRSRIRQTVRLGSY